MNDLDSADPNIQTAILEAFAEGVSAAVLLYDRNDLVVFSSQQLASIIPVDVGLMKPGARMRDLLTGMYDAGIRLVADTYEYRRALSREDWVAEQIAGLWKERTETIERPGLDRWIRVVKRRLPSGYGVCVVKDVSEQKKREEQWRLDTERVQVTEEVLDNLPFPISVKDRNGTFVAINKANCDFLDMTAEAVLGHRSAEINSAEVELRLGGINKDVYETGESVRIPEYITRPDGSTVAVMVHKYRIGRPGRYYLVTVKQDVSDLIAEGGQDGSLIPLLRPEDFVRTDLTREKSVPPAADPPNEARLSARILVVTANPQVETEAVGLLVEGGFDASAVSGADELALFLQLASDAGIGIDMVALDADMPDECRHVAEAHGVAVLSFFSGQLRHALPTQVRAELQRTCHDRAAPLEDDWDIAPVANENGIDVLVVEDNEVNQIVFSQIIEGFGYRYALAVDGEEAVQLWREKKPRIILMDVTLPKLNGFEAAAAIRELEAPEERVPVIGVLPHAFDRDREACFEAGMDEVILKPISPEALDAVLNRYLVAMDGDEAIAIAQGAPAFKA
jgi:PAS domain S-box-containing protein